MAHMEISPRVFLLRNELLYFFTVFNKVIYESVLTFIKDVEIPRKEILLCDVQQIIREKF